MIPRRKIGNIDLDLTELGVGTAPLGGWPIEESETQALTTFETAWSNGIRYFDTAPLYGSGMAEFRLGNFFKNKKREYLIENNLIDLRSSIIYFKKI